MQMSYLQKFIFWLALYLKEWNFWFWNINMPRNLSWSVYILEKRELELSCFIEGFLIWKKATKMILSVSILLRKPDNIVKCAFNCCIKKTIEAAECTSIWRSSSHYSVNYFLSKLFVETKNLLLSNKSHQNEFH